MPGRKFDAGSQYRYGFNGQEKSTEISEGLNTAEFWEYDSTTGRRWNVDPVKMTPLSPYSTFKPNPVFFYDVHGDIFNIGKGQKARDDVKGMVKKDNRDFIKISKNGSVSLDFGTISEDQRNAALKDGGLKLISDLVESKKNYYYGNDQYALVFQHSKSIATVDYYDNYRNGGDGSITTIFNLSNNGKNSNGENISMLGYDGAVLIGENALYEQFESEYSSQKVPLSRSNILFHELAENYERTENGVDYKNTRANKFKGAHELAIKRESTYWNPSSFPGQPASASGATIINIENKPAIYRKYGAMFLLINIIQGTATKWEKETFGLELENYLIGIITQ